ncbi:uncharacterized protein TRUGW13939_11547 [Talaromyces rugulosus]|uniref:Uncharacterized protein n=1 Tax=Talaromyces rugulosus TaxID=121627 RepID=A0A7H8RIE0_TALRU|nr:uncharacterized protein TRUGW13939_11547 [Talaromyces rugulosus]QKX64373.1 hypothetical protein TRUGW13939_11547 [Talaromyces rugulosus]
MTASTLGSQMRRVEITGFEVIVKPYCLRYVGAKAFNNSEEVSEALQNVMLQHRDISTSVRHYDVDVDAQDIIPQYASRGLRTTDTVTRRKQKWNDRKAKFERACMACHARFGSLDEVTLSQYHRPLWEKLQRFQAQAKEAKQRYDRAVRELRNEKQRQRNRRIRENLQRYRDEQSVIDLECQLAGITIDTKAMETLDRQDSMSAQHLTYIESMLP